MGINMNIIGSIIAALLTSTIVSAVVSFVLKTWFEARLKHHFELELEKLRHSYEVELEKLKTQLMIMAETAHELTERRLTAYPQIVELIYRVRNIAREIVAPTDTPPVLVDEFAARTGELENSLYVYRMDLERDGIFLPIHTFKNKAKAFNRLLEDRDHYQSREEQDEVSRISTELRSLYAEIERQHKPVIESLSGIIPYEKERHYDVQAS
jgi:hypothetical protein